MVTKMESNGTTVQGVHLFTCPACNQSVTARCHFDFDITYLPRSNDETDNMAMKVALDLRPKMKRIVVDHDCEKKSQPRDPNRA